MRIAREAKCAAARLRFRKCALCALQWNAQASSRSVLNVCASSAARLGGGASLAEALHARARARSDLSQHDVANNGGLEAAEFRQLIAPLGIAAAEKWRAEKTLQAFQCLFGFHEICTEHQHVRVIVFARKLCDFGA
jgi:hypothetical protein